MTEPKRAKVNMSEGSSSGNDSRKSDMPLCQLSSHDFAIIRNTRTYVDKTLFIKTFLNATSKIVLLTAPRAFGKTTLMDMLKQFLLGKTSLFEDLNICTKEKDFFSKHCRLHPVIHIDLGSVHGSNFAEVKEELAYAINKAFVEHKYLVKKTDGGKLAWASEKLNIADIQVETFEKFYLPQTCITLSEANLKHSLKFLSEVLHTHYEEKVFLLIDEYDAPAVSMVLGTFSNDDIQLVGYFLERFMTNTVKLNNFLGRSLIFACVRLAGAFSGNARRYIRHYPFLSEPRYAPYLGFTYQEVERLLQIPEVKKAIGGKDAFETMANWYDGYEVAAGDSTVKIFNSWSVLNLLNNICTSSTLKYLSYWVDKGYINNLQELFVEPLIRQKIEKIMNCGTINIMTIIRVVSIENIICLNKLMSSEHGTISKENDDVDLFFLFLADSGYFNIHQEDPIYCRLKMPNFEISQHLAQVYYSEEMKIVNEYNLNSEDIQTYLNNLKLVLGSPSEIAFVNLSNAVLKLVGSACMITNESELHHILYTLVYISRCFVTHSEVQIKKNSKGPGKAPTLDMVIIMKENGIIFEYKVNSKSAQEALEQIFKKKYHTKFDESDYAHISNKIYAGLAFDITEKKVYITYKVESEGESKSVCSNILLT